MRTSGFLIGFQQRGKPPLKAGPVWDLFKDGFGEIEDVDVILIPDLGPDGPNRTSDSSKPTGQLSRSANPSTDDLIDFLEKKKLCFSAPDNDLILIIHLEQAIAWDWVPLTAHLQLRRRRRRSVKIFMLAQTSLDPLRPIWTCRQIYPRMLPLKDMDLDTARAVLGR